MDDNTLHLQEALEDWSLNSGSNELLQVSDDEYYPNPGKLIKSVLSKIFLVIALKR